MRYKLVVLAITVFITSCYDVEVENPACIYSKKTETPQDAVLMQFLKPFAGVDPRIKQVGELLNYYENVRVQNAQNFPVQYYESSLESIVNNEEQKKTSFNFKKTVIGSENSAHPGEVVTGYSFSFDTPSENITLQNPNVYSTNFKKSSSGVSDNPRSESSCSVDLTNDLTFHKLRSKEILVDPPQGFIDAGCPGLESCKLRVHQFDFKIVLKLSSTEVVVYNHEIQLSPDVPFLGPEHMPSNYLFFENPEGIIYNGLVSHCVENWNEDDLFIRRCTVLTDFRYSN